MPGDQSFSLEEEGQLFTLHENDSFKIELEFPYEVEEEMLCRISDVESTLIFSRIKDDKSIYIWSHTLDFFSGFLDVQIFQGDCLWYEKTLDIDPHQAKLTRDQFNRMIEEIQQEADICFSLSPIAKKFFQGQNRNEWTLSSYESFRHCFAELVNVVEVICKNPIRHLRNQKVIINIEQMKRIDSNTPVWIATHGVRNLKEVNLQIIPGFDRRVPALIEQTNKITTVDVYENRLMKFFLLDLVIFLRKSVEGFARLLHSDDSYVSQLSCLRKAEAKKWQNRFVSLLQKDVFKEIQSGAFVMKGLTPVLQKHPAYRNLYRFYLRFKRILSVKVQGPPIYLSIHRTYQLYEYWCYFQLVRKFRLEGKIESTAGMFRVKEKGGMQVLLEGKDSCLLLKDGSRLYFQKTYTNQGKEAKSYTFPMRPDISMELFYNDKLDSIIVYDPKYRVARDGIREALGDMHKYRDGIIKEPFGVMDKAVQKTVIMVPDDKAKQWYQSETMEGYGMEIEVWKIVTPTN